MAIIQKGDLKTVGSVHDVLNASAAGSENTVAVAEIEIAAEQLTTLEETIRLMPGIVHVYTNEKTITVEAEDSITTAAINKYCFEKGIVLSQLMLKKKSLETRFLEITGGKSDR